VFSKSRNTKTHIGDELNFTWIHMFLDGKLAFQTTCDPGSPEGISVGSWAAALTRSGVMCRSG
jgi:hypothetical protein